ncbi:1,4-dihydroxy-2-naphthoyl-CoA hydrolase [bacterium HR28]|nr:1,4-dihydroxy-2-naphthoyl-CoA hydrolase [bacterium HR28]
MEQPTETRSAISMQTDIGKDTFRFWFPWRVRYRDCDKQGVVYFAVYLEYIEHALMEYFRALGIDLRRTIEEGSFDWAAVHAEIDWRSPAVFDDELAIGLRVSRIGRSSFDVEFAVTNAEKNVLHAVGRLVLVCFDVRTRQARPVPDFVRQAVERFEGWAC